MLAIWYTTWKHLLAIVSLSKFVVKILGNIPKDNIKIYASYYFSYHHSGRMYESLFI